MDGSFLSDPAVVAASREFVCIRLATYEDKAEAAFLAKLFRGRDGQLQNTVFALLSPDSKEVLTRTGRGPHFAFRNPDEMAAFMQEVVSQYEVQEIAPMFPVMKNLTLALNVAACDGLQLVISVTSGASDVESRIAQSAWQPQLIGQFVYARATPEELKPISGVQVEEGMVIADPDDFGISGLAIAELGGEATQEAIAAAMRTALDNRLPKTMNPREHIRAGVQLGIDWATAIPVTDQQSLRAKARYRSDK